MPDQVGHATGEVCRKTGISEQTFYRWKEKFAGRLVDLRVYANKVTPETSGGAGERNRTSNRRFTKPLLCH